MKQNRSNLLYDDGRLALHRHLVDEEVLDGFKANVKSLFRRAKLRNLTIADYYVIVHQAHQQLDLEFTKCISRIRFEAQKEAGK